jgi:hypothetical protein
MREVTLMPRTPAGLLKFTVATLTAVLAARGLNTAGQKADLVKRLLEVLPPDDSL